MMLDILNSPVWILVGMVEVSAMMVLMLGVLLDSAVGVLRGICVGVDRDGWGAIGVVSMREINEGVK